MTETQTQTQNTEAKRTRKPKGDPLNGTRKPDEAMKERGAAWIAAALLIGFRPGTELRDSTRDLITTYFGELKLSASGVWAVSGFSKTSANVGCRAYLRGLSDAGIRISDVQIPVKRYGAPVRSVTGLEMIHADPKSAPESI